MNKFIFFLFFTVLASVETCIAQSNESFNLTIAGIKPIKWSEYEPLQKDAISCVKDWAATNKQKPVCEMVNQKHAQTLLNGIIHASLINVSFQSKKFCDDKIRDAVIHEEKWNEAAAYALLILDEHMKYGSSLYGADLPSTYISKILYDALYLQSPCKD